MTENEHERAKLELVRTIAADDYFADRPSSDTPSNRRIFDHAFERGFESGMETAVHNGVVLAPTGQKGMFVRVVTGGVGSGQSYGHRPYTVGGDSDSLAGTTASMGQLEAKSDGPAIKWVWRDIEL